MTLSLGSRVSGATAVSLALALLAGVGYVGAQEPYLVFDEPLAWEDAKERCQREGTNLLTIANLDADTRFYEYMMSTHPNMNVWIGADDNDIEGQFEWISGAPVNYANWDTNEPNGNGNENCVEYRVDVQGWNDIDCAQERAFACGPRERYLLFGNLATWEDAKATCESYGSNLLTIADLDADTRFYDYMFSTHPDMNVWIGANDNDNEGRFEWTSGAPVNYANWDTNEPNGNGNENCVEYRVDVQGWNDLDCAEERAFACDPYVLERDDYTLLMRHRNAANGFFAPEVLTTGVENPDNPNANTYSIIGAVDPATFLLDDEWYEFELTYWYADGPTDVLTWAQDSWITESTIGNVDLSAISDANSDDVPTAFRGLAKSSNTATYLDGSPGHANWYHAVASVNAYLGGIPGHQGRVAQRSELWVRKVGEGNGLPLGDSQVFDRFRPGMLVRFESLASDNRFLAHNDDTVELSIAALDNTVWRVLPGVSGYASSVSFIAYDDLPEPRYLRHSGFDLWADTYSDDRAFREDASWLASVNREDTGPADLSLIPSNSQDLVLSVDDDGFGTSITAPDTITQEQRLWRVYVIEESPLVELTPGLQVRFESVNSPHHFLSRDGLNVQTASSIETASTWTVIPGLNGDANALSFKMTERVRNPRFLRHEGYALYAHEFQDAALFRDDASWIAEARVDGANRVYYVLVSSNFPDYTVSAPLNLQGSIISGESSDSNLWAWISDEVTPPPAKDDLVFAVTANVDLIVTDAGSGADWDLKAWKPILPEGYRNLGHSVSNRMEIPGLCYIAKASGDDVLRAPNSFALVWADHGSGADSNFSFWKPLCPGGFVSVGDVIVHGWGTPSVNEIMCVREEYAEPAPVVGPGWWDKGSGANNDVTAWRLQNSPGVYTTGSYSQPGGTPAWRIRHEWIFNDYADDYKLPVAITPHVSIIATDVGSGAHMDLKAWRANCPEGWYTLGSTVSNTFNLPQPGMCVQHRPGLTATPTGYTHKWESRGSGSDQDISFWWPIAPPGFTAVGGVIALGYSQPSLSDVRVLKTELTEGGSIRGVAWWDQGSGANQDGSSWSVVGSPLPRLDAGYGQPSIGQRFSLPAPLEIDRVEITLVGTPNLFEERPDFLEETILENNSGSEQRVNFTVSRTRTNTVTMEHTAGVSITVGKSVTTSVPLGPSSTLNIETTVSYEFKYGEMDTTTVSFARTYNVVVGAYKYLKATVLCTRIRASIPYEGTVYYKDTDHTEAISGLWHSVSYGASYVKYEESDL